MTGEDLQKLTQERILEAKTLLVAKRWAGVFYLAGYAVECGLKSCVLVRLAAEVGMVFDDRRFSEKCWTHNLVQLVDLAGLTTVLEDAMKANPDLQDNWEVVQKWTEARRYQFASKNEAEGLYEAITDRKQGMLSWIKKYW